MSELQEAFCEQSKKVHHTILRKTPSTKAFLMQTSYEIFCCLNCALHLSLRIASYNWQAPSCEVQTNLFIRRSQIFYDFFLGGPNQVNRNVDEVKPSLSATFSLMSQGSDKHIFVHV